MNEPSSCAAILLKIKELRFFVAAKQRFYQYRQRLSCVLLLAGCAVLSACSLPGPTGAGSNTSTNKSDTLSSVDRAIINDHINVIEQIFDPLSTTLQINNNNTDSRLDTFVRMLAQRGYGIQRVSADQGANYFSYGREQSTDVQQPLIKFTTIVGAVEISRDYWLLSKSAVSPASPVRLSGTRAAVNVDAVAIDNKQIANQDNSTVTYVASLELDEQSPVISLVTSDLVDKVARDTVQSSAIKPADPGAPSLQALNASRMEINNLFYADSSVFGSVLDDYTKVERQVVVFANDSMVLGNANKALLNQFIDTSLQNDDIVSLVGCSNGQTALDIGNEGLALGRAKRVTEALMARGVARERVLDEGCWAPVSAGDKFPARGVVLELWRKK